MAAEGTPPRLTPYQHRVLRALATATRCDGCNGRHAVSAWGIGIRLYEGGPLAAQERAVTRALYVLERAGLAEHSVSVYVGTTMWLPLTRGSGAGE